MGGLGSERNALEQGTLILAEISLAAGAVYSGVKRLWSWAAALAAGALLLLTEAVRAL